ncbi:MAG: hypothetical protein ACRCS9_06580 [Hyphomicrobium sp.]
MNYKLVLQFVGDDEETLDQVIELEDQLITVLGGTSAEVDGHETGEGVTYLTIDVRNPAKAWEKIEPVVEVAASADLELSAVAFRAADGDDYTVLWPADFEGEFEMA